MTKPYKALPPSKPIMAPKPIFVSVKQWLAASFAIGLLSPLTEITTAATKKTKVISAVCDEDQLESPGDFNSIDSRLWSGLIWRLLRGLPLCRWPLRHRWPLASSLTGGLQLDAAGTVRALEDQDRLDKWMCQCLAKDRPGATQKGSLDPNLSDLGIGRRGVTGRRLIQYCGHDATSSLLRTHACGQATLPCPRNYYDSSCFSQEVPLSH